MAGFGLPQPGDFYNRSQQAMAGAQGATGQMVNLHNINSSNALQAQQLAMNQQAMMMDEAYRRDALAQRGEIENRRLQGAAPSTGDRIIGGLGGAFTGYMMGSALGGQGGSAMWGYGGAALGALGGFL